MSADIAVPTRYWTVVAALDTDFLECNYLYVGVTGNLVARCTGADIAFPNLAVGYHPIRCTRIVAAGTTIAIPNILKAN